MSKNQYQDYLLITDKPMYAEISVEPNAGSNGETIVESKPDANPPVNLHKVISEQSSQMIQLVDIINAYNAENYNANYKIKTNNNKIYYLKLIIIIQIIIFILISIGLYNAMKNKN